MPLAQAVREAALWVFGALALIMLVALLTYDDRDPGFSRTGDGAAVRNQIGSAGAWFADVCYSLFGIPAFLFPAMVLLTGWLIFTQRSSAAPLDRALLGARFGGFLATLATSCGLATLHFTGSAMPQTAGGAFGQLVGTSLASALGSLGGTLLLLALWLGAVSLFTGISWLTVMDRVGKGVLDGLDELRDMAQVVQEKLSARRAQQQRQETVTRTRQETQARKRPRIEPVLPAP